jgi:drug/metabolite transporter (DMT)-like permease
MNSGTRKSQKGLDWTIVVIVNFLWATQVPIIRLIGDNLGPVTIAFLPIILSTLLLLPLLIILTKKHKRRFLWHWSDIKYFIFPGFIGIFVMQFAYTIGAQRTLAANAGIITLTIPVFVAIFSSFMLKEKMNIVRIFSFILAIIGVLFTSVSDISEANFIQNEFFVGNLIFLFACICCANYNTYVKKLVDKGYTEIEILVYNQIVGIIFSIPLLIWLEPFNLQEFLASGKDAILGILGLTIFVYAVSWILFLYVLKRMDVTQAILGNYLMPFFIALLGIVLLGESITPIMIIGGSIVLISTLLVTVYENQLLKLLQRRKKKQLT